ncbi:MAG: dockerin type I repeat-containing protein [Clostridiales Family XIII bacterium]|nr:dockerin type I repeat-containing protein [Clostridiales Family XIII bacterium]
METYGATFDSQTNLLYLLSGLTGDTVYIYHFNDEPLEDTGAPGSGDIDGDGTVTITDALSAARAILNLESLSEAKKLAADMDEDGQITMTDVILIARKAAGL